MNRLTDVLGQPVRTTSGRAVGKLVDVVADVQPDADGGPPRISRLVVARQRRRYEVGWDDVARFEPGQIEVTTTTVETTPPAELGPHELLLARDVLDAQIVDLTGHRLTRAGDVVLTRTADSTLVVVGIDVGFGAVLRRIGLRRWGTHRGAEIVAWPELHLASRRGHEVQLVAANAHLHHLSPGDLAHLLARLSTAHAGAVLRTASVDRAAAALAASHDEVGSRLLSSMDTEAADALLDALPPERAHALRRRLHPVGRVRRRYHRTRGWKRHAPPDGSAQGAAPDDAAPGR